MCIDESLNVCLCIMCVPGAGGGHRRAPNPLGTEYTCYCWERNSGRSLGRAVSTLKSWVISQPIKSLKACIVLIPVVKGCRMTQVTSLTPHTHLSALKFLDLMFLTNLIFRAQRIHLRVSECLEWRAEFPQSPQL